MDTKDIEKQLLAEEQAENARQFAEKVKRRQEELEMERLGREKAAERQRAQLLRAMDQQPILGIASSRVRRMLPDTYPISYIRLPIEVVEILEGAFEITGPILLSKVLSTLLVAFAGGDAEHRREARKKGDRVFPGAMCFVPIIPVNGYSLEGSSALIVAWSLAYRERQSAREALLKEESL